MYLEFRIRPNLERETLESFTVCSVEDMGWEYIFNIYIYLYIYMTFIKTQTVWTKKERQTHVSKECKDMLALETAG